MFQIVLFLSLGGVIVQTTDRVRGYNSEGRLIYDVPARWSHLFPRAQSVSISNTTARETVTVVQEPSRVPALSAENNFAVEDSIWENSQGNIFRYFLLKGPQSLLEDKLRSILLIGSVTASFNENYDPRLSLQFNEICDQYSELIIPMIAKNYLENWPHRFQMIRPGISRTHGINLEDNICGLCLLLTPFWNLDSICPDLMNDEKIFRIINLQRVFRGEFIVKNRGTFFPRAIVDRKRILESSLNQLFNGNFFEYWNAKEIGGIYVKFHGENGIDQGGVFMDWITSIGRALVAENIFVPTEEGAGALTINLALKIPDNILQLIGVVLGLAVLHDAYIGIPISVGLFKYLLGEKVLLEELKFEFPQLHKNLSEYDSKILTDISFVVGDHELIPGGASVIVDEKNLVLYHRAFAHWKMVKSFEKQFERIQFGFSKILGKNYREKFSPLMTASRMQRIFCGEIGEPLVDEFFKLIEWGCFLIQTDLCERQKQRMEEFILKLASLGRLGDFLHFVTASRILDSRRVQIIFRNFSDSDQRFPSASTCTRSITIPVYSADAIFETQMMLALNNIGSREFGLH